MEGIEGASPDGTVAGLFTPEPNSAALVFLRRLIGCTFDKIWTPGGGAGGGGSCNDVNDVNGGVKTGHGAEQKSATLARA